MDIHTLAIQMGTSIAMIERHYSHLTPRLRKEMLTGKQYVRSREEYHELTETSKKEGKQIFAAAGLKVRYADKTDLGDCLIHRRFQRLRT